MNQQMITVDTTTPEYCEAVQLHQEIMANATVAASALLEMSKGLKQMRDGKLYMQFGFESFGEYVVQMTGFKERQAYNYISVYERVGEKFLQANASLGITKLNLLAQLPLEERDELLQNNDLNGMSVSEVKALIDKNKQVEKQMTLLQGEYAEAQNKLDGVEKLREQLHELREENAALKNAPPALPSLEEVLRIKQEAQEKADAAAEASIQAAVNEAERTRKQLEAARAEVEKLKNKPAKLSAKELAEIEKKAQEKALAEAQKKMKAEVEEARRVERETAEKELGKKYQDMMDSLRSEKEVAASKLVELEKKTAAGSTDPELLRFNFYFESAQLNLQQMNESRERLKINNPELAEKLNGAMRKFIDSLPGQIGL
ncbi:MAG: DUF3102 domain-containing protein [Provencibacterium sp.]|nr:DUF3102 domain-containing protein [Provencibacterium sp.]